MNLIFIGSGSGKASLNRYHSSILLSTTKSNLLVDAGDGINRALLSASIDYNSINAVLFSHFHPDHYTGFASLIVQMKMNKRSCGLKLFIHESLVDVIKNFLLNSYLFPERLGFEINYLPFNKNDIINIDEELRLQVIENSHLSELAEMSKYPSLSYFSGSFLFFYGMKKVFYSSDIGNEKDILNPEVYSSDVMVIEVTHLSHDAIIHVVNKCKPGVIYFTHLSDGDEKSLASLQQKLKVDFGLTSHIAIEGLNLKI